MCFVVNVVVRHRWVVESLMEVEVVCRWVDVAGLSDLLLKYHGILAALQWGHRLHGVHYWHSVTVIKVTWFNQLHLLRFLHEPYPEVPYRVFRLLLGLHSRLNLWLINHRLFHLLRRLQVIAERVFRKPIRFLKANLLLLETAGHIQRMIRNIEFLFPLVQLLDFFGHLLIAIYFMVNFTLARVMPQMHREHHGIPRLGMLFPIHQLKRDLFQIVFNAKGPLPHFQAVRLTISGSRCFFRRERRGSRIRLIVQLTRPSLLLFRRRLLRLLWFNRRRCWLRHRSYCGSSPQLHR